MVRGFAVKGVVFDLDGTLVHTTVDFRVMKARLFRVLAEEGIPSSLLDERMTMARNLALVREHLSGLDQNGITDRISAAVTNSMNRTEMERVHETTAIEGAGDCLRSLIERGIGVGLLTRGSREYALAALHHAGITTPFRAMVCRDDHPEDEAKPNGKAMRRTLALMGLEPCDCLLVGDHAMDRECAIATAVPFVGVLTGSFTEQDWRRIGCDAFIASVAHLPRLLEGGNLYLDGKA